MLLVCPGLLVEASFGWAFSTSRGEGMAVRNAVAATVKKLNHGMLHVDIFSLKFSDKDLDIR